MHASYGRPGEPENSARAGMTVFGGTIVLSAIFAQSLMIANLPYMKNECTGNVTRCSTDNDAVFSDFDMVANGRSFYDRIMPDVNMVSYLHRVVIEISAIGFVWGSE
jgi:hypothetical protein